MNVRTLAIAVALFSATAANAAVDLYAGNGKIVERFASLADCQQAGQALKLPYTCRAQQAPPVSARAADPAPSSPAGTTVTAWVRAGVEYTRDMIDAPSGAMLRLGDGLQWVTKPMPAKGTAQCTQQWFAADTSKMAYTKWCEVQVTAPAVTQVPGAMPVVNRGLIPKPAVVPPGPRVLTLNAQQLAVAGFNPAGSDIGAFRVSCPYSHISNDDPIVYPGKPGASHLHTFSGNTLADAASTTESLNGSGASTCGGGTLNRTAYWMPSMIDTRTGQPIVPLSTNFYYKGGYQGVDSTKIVPFPKGLRMIAGNPQFTSSHPEVFVTQFRCIGPKDQNFASDHVMSCDVGAQLWVTVTFPQCWDGKNLDSPDHKSHMSYGIGQRKPDGSPNGSKTGCPASHPVPLPEVALNVQYLVTEPGVQNFWKLSSDMYDGPGGYSLHADWFGAWDDDTMKLWVRNCINKKQDCHDHLLGDGRMLE